MARNPRTRHPNKARKNRSYEQKIDKPIAITPVEYGGLQQAYDHFNKELFEGELPDVFITYQRKAHSHGYFAPDRFSGRVDDESGRHELALSMLRDHPLLRHECAARALCCRILARLGLDVETVQPRAGRPAGGGSGITLAPNAWEVNAPA